MNFSENKIHTLKGLLTLLPTIDNFQICLKNDSKMSKDQKMIFVRMIDANKLIHY